MSTEAVALRYYSYLAELFLLYVPICRKKKCLKSYLKASSSMRDEAVDHDIPIFGGSIYGYNTVTFSIIYAAKTMFRFF